MANEITVSVGLSVNNGNYVESFQAAGLRFDQTTQLASAGITNVSTATVATVTLGEITTAGYAAFRNLSTATAGTAYIALGAYDGTNLHEFVQLRRGQPAVLPLNSTATIGAKAYGSAGRLRYVILSE